MKLKITCSAVLASLALCAGCNTALNSGHVVSVTERIYGIKVAEAVANETPEIVLGISSTTVLLEPTITNAVLNVPSVANTFSLQQGGTPFNLGVDESFASGTYQTGGISNAVTSQPVVPK